MDGRSHIDGLEAEGVVIVFSSVKHIDWLGLSWKYHFLEGRYRRHLFGL